MLKAMHAGFLLHLTSFYALSKNVSLTQYIVISTVIDWAVVEMIFGVLTCLGIDRGLIQVHHVVDAL